MSGVGSTIQVAIGGSLDCQAISAVAHAARVRLLADGRFRSESFGEEWYAVQLPFLDMDNFTLVVSSRAVSLYDRSFFYAHGQNPKTFDAVVIKSPHCQHHMFAAWCSRMINIDAPCSSSATCLILAIHVARDLFFPLDTNVRFERTCERFQRC